MAKARKYTDEQLKEAVKTSFSTREVMNKLGLNKDGGGSALHMKRLIKQFDLDTSHFTGQLWNKGKTLPPKTDLKDYFSGKVNITSHNLRVKLIKRGHFEHKCYSCNQSSWTSTFTTQEILIPLNLHHIDGNHYNNKEDNLMLLCPNCHATCHKNNFHKEYYNELILEEQEDDDPIVCSYFYYELEPTCMI